MTPYPIRKVKLAELRAAGMCHRCHAKPKEHGVRCLPCAEQQREYNRFYQRTSHRRPK